jgi:hypothetical protein
MHEVSGEQPPELKVLEADAVVAQHGLERFTAELEQQDTDANRRQRGELGALKLQESAPFERGSRNQLNPILLSFRCFFIPYETPQLRRRWDF